MVMGGGGGHMPYFDNNRMQANDEEEEEVDRDVKMIGGCGGGDYATSCGDQL